MNWAKERAERIEDEMTVRAVTREERERIVAAELQRVAEECAQTIEDLPELPFSSALAESTRQLAIIAIREKFPKEQS